MRLDWQVLTDKALERLGGWYLPVSVLVAQLFAFITSPALLISQNNAEFTAQQFWISVQIIVVMSILGTGLTTLWAYYTNRDVTWRIDELVKGRRTPSHPARQRNAWRQANSLSLRFALVAFIVCFVGESGPAIAYLYLAFHISGSQIIYTLLGTLAATIAGTTLAIMLLEQLLVPLRRKLIPATFEGQLEGTDRFGLSAKLSGIFASLILVSILIIAPIGYRHTYLAATAPQSAGQTLLAFQYESVFMTLLILLLGSILAYVVVRSLTAPIQHMVQAFQLIEQGDLTQRISVTAPDELGELAIYFNHMIGRLADLQGSLETQVKERTGQLRATVQVANAVGGILDADDLMEQVVNLIAKEFGYYYVALFLVDSTNKWAELRAATGDAGQVLRANHHRLEIGSKSMVGRSISTRQAVVALDTGEGQIRFDNPLLPYTRSEIALPLIVSDRVFGALDAQSTHEAAFGPQDIETLQTMANQVAIALENARLFQESQRALQDMRAIQQQYLLTSWKNFAEEKGVLDYELGEIEPGESVSELKVPLTLRDQPIGEISLAGENDWTPEEKSMIQAIAAQAALALENARLVEESQSSARRERLVAEITGKIWSSATIDGILQTAAKELGRALETDEVTIELKADES